ncbi:MAG: hypothetical protein ABW019_12645, partial [Chitinophagaceae bacterium]
IVLPALLAIGTITGLTAKAQNTAATAQVSVTLASILDIHIGNATGTDAAVAIPAFNSAERYQNGVQEAKTDHLYIVASKGFTVQASATDLSDGSGHTIPAGGINILGADGSSGSTNKPAGTSYLNLNLANTAANFITATGGTPLYTFNVTYTLGGSTRAAYFIGKEPGSYSSTVTYTIIP